jgi:hypothetical protein
LRLRLRLRSKRSCCFRECGYVPACCFCVAAASRFLLLSRLRLLKAF